MDLLPADAAEELKECAMSAGMSTANERFGTSSEAAAHKVRWNERAENFQKKMDGFLSVDVCKDIKSMFWFQAWHTANERKGYKSDAARDVKDVKKRYETILGRQEITEDLASHVHSMGWNVAWYCANTKYGYKGDAKGDKTNFEECYRKISGGSESTVPKVNVTVVNESKYPIQCFCLPLAAGWWKKQVPLDIGNQSQATGVLEGAPIKGDGALKLQVLGLNDEVTVVISFGGGEFTTFREKGIIDGLNITTKKQQLGYILYCTINVYGNNEEN